MVTFTAHLRVTIKCLTRYKEKVVVAAVLEGKSMPSNMATNTNHTTPLNAFPLKFLGVRQFLGALTIFGISKIPTHCLKEALVK